jgi:hypothetical protein
MSASVLGREPRCVTFCIWRLRQVLCRAACKHAPRPRSTGCHDRSHDRCAPDWHSARNCKADTFSRSLACLAQVPHWTKPRINGIKAKQTCLGARERVEGPGFCQEFSRAFVYSVSAHRIARVRRQCMPSIGINQITTALLIYNDVRFNQRKSRKIAVNYFEDRAR